MSADARRDHLTRCALEALGASAPSGRWALPTAEMTALLHNSPAMQEFLEQPAVRTLQVSAVPTGDRGSGPCELTVSNAVGVSSGLGTAAAGVVFTKTSADVLTAENIATAVMMSTLGESPLQTLQLSIKQLFGPILLQDPQWSNQLDTNTRQTLEALNHALEAAIQLGGAKAVRCAHGYALCVPAASSSSARAPPPLPSPPETLA